MIEEVKTLRKQIDGLAELTKELKTIYVPSQRLAETDIDKDIILRLSGIFLINSEEINNVVINLYLTNAWLGKVLEELGETVSMDTRELNAIPMNNYNDMSHTEKVNWLKEEIKSVTEQIKNFPVNKIVSPINREIFTAFTVSYRYLTEARFHLEFELQRIKNN